MLVLFCDLAFENHMPALTIPVHDQKFGWTIRKSVIAASAVQHKSLFFFFIFCVSYACISYSLFFISFCFSRSGWVQSQK